MTCLNEREEERKKERKIKKMQSELVLFSKIEFVTPQNCRGGD
jgi:hypothetical protein